MRRPLTRGITLCHCLFAGVFWVLPLAAAQTIAQDQRILVTRDRDAGRRTVSIAAQDGLLRWRDVLRGLAQAGDLDPPAIQDEFSGRTLDLTQHRTRWSLRAVSAAVPDVKIRTVRDPAGTDWTLQIRLDDRAACQKVRRLKSLLREKWVNQQGTYGLFLDEGWNGFSFDRPLVVLIHGYSAGRPSLLGFQRELTAQGWPSAMFLYANDGPLAESAELLAEELRGLRQEHPAWPVAIVAHSMGGLVARAALEDPALDPGNVTRLIMVAAPNHGTQWAELPGGLDWWEFALEPPSGTIKKKFIASLADGLDEAHGDVRPSSDFLRLLNARPRNPNVRYSLILGTGAPFDAQDIRRLREGLAREVQEHRTTRLFAPRMDRFLDGLTEIERGQGDGVVSVDRGRLDGVPDVLLLPMTHSDLTRDLNHPDRTALRDAILERLAGRTLHPLIKEPDG